MTLNRNYYYLIGLIAGTLIFVTFCGYMIRQSTKAAEKLEVEIAGKKTEKTELQRIDDYDETLKNKKAIMENYKLVLEDALPSEFKVPEAIMYFKNMLVEMKGAEVPGFFWNVSGKKYNKGLVTIPVSFVATGGYNQAMELVKKVENSRWLIGLSTIYFKEEGNAMTVGVSGNLYLRAPSDAGKSSAAGGTK